MKKVHKPSDIVKAGDTVEAVMLSGERGRAADFAGAEAGAGRSVDGRAAKKFPVGSAIEGPVTRIMKFGAFVQLTEGVEGLVHISEITAERRINHPQDVLHVGQVVKAQVLGVDAEKRQIKLSMKQLVPTSFGEYLEEHKVGDVVSGRVVEQSAESTRRWSWAKGFARCADGDDAGWPQAKASGGGGGLVGADVDAEGALEGWRGAGGEPAGATGRGADSELPDCEAGSRCGED